MRTNRILNILNTITSWLFLPFQMLGTFILGVLAMLSFDLLLLPFHLIWIVVFWAPLIGLSFIWERVRFARPLISVVGVSLASLACVYASLLPAGANKTQRVSRLFFAYVFPYNYSLYAQLKNQSEEYIANALPLYQIEVYLAAYNADFKAYLNTIMNF